MAKLYFRYGAMGSSKTANAIMVQYNYHERGQNALILKPRLDNRDGARVVGSRSGLSAPCAYVEELDEIDLSGYNCLIVDEAQFLTKAQVEKLVAIVDDRNIPVICYGLRADFQGNLFEGSTWLMAWADTIEEIKTVCWCGRKATFNARVSGGRVIKSGEQILLGGNESYVALCRRHWKNGWALPVTIRKVTDREEIDRLMPLMLESDPSEEMVRQNFDRAESDVYVLEVGGKTVSEVIVKTAEEEAPTCEIENLATVPEYRGHGYASALVRDVLKRYESYKHICVGTDKFMVPFYERFGFRYSYELEDFYLSELYDQPVIVNGEQLKDLIILSLGSEPGDDFDEDDE